MKQSVIKQLNDNRNKKLQKSSGKEVNTWQLVESIQVAKDGEVFEKFLSIFYLDGKMYTFSHTQWPSDKTLGDKGVEVNNRFVQHFKDCKDYLRDNEHLYLNPYTVVMVKMPYDLVRLGLIKL